MTSVAEVLESARWDEGHIGRDEWDYSNNTPGEPSVVAEFQTPRPIVLQEDAPLEFVIPAHETFTVDGTADNQETFTLSHDAIAETSIETTPTDADDQVAEMALGTSAAQTSRLTLGRGRIVFPDGVDHGPATSDGSR